MPYLIREIVDVKQQAVGGSNRNYAPSSKAISLSGNVEAVDMICISYLKLSHHHICTFEIYVVPWLCFFSFFLILFLYSTRFPLLQPLSFHNTTNSHYQIHIQ